MCLFITDWRLRCCWLDRPTYHLLLKDRQIAPTLHHSQITLIILKSNLTLMLSTIEINLTSFSSRQIAPTLHHSQITLIILNILRSLSSLWNQTLHQSHILLKQTVRTHFTPLSDCFQIILTSSVHNFYQYHIFLKNIYSDLWFVIWIQFAVSMAICM